MSGIERFTARVGGNIRESMGAMSGAGALLPAAAAPPLQYQGITRPKDTLTIPVDRIIPDPDQPRKEFAEGPLAELAASLKARGQLQPVRVRWDAASDRWVIIAGERRYRAALLAGITSLMCVEAKGAMTADDILEDQLVENCVREDLKPIEQARAFKALIDRRGCSYRQLAEALNVSHMAVSRALALLELPEDLQGRVTSGALAASVAVEVAKLDDPAAQRELADRVVAEGMNRADAVEAVRRSARPSKGRGGKPRKVVERVVRASNGVRLTLECRKGLDVDLMLAALVEAVASLTAEKSAAAEGRDAA